MSGLLQLIGYPDMIAIMSSPLHEFFAALPLQGSRSSRLCFCERLLLRQAMQSAKPPHQIDRVDADHAM